MNSIESVIKDKEFSLLKPEIRSSPESLERLIAEDFIEFGSSGLIYNKSNILEHLPKETGILFVVSNFKARILAENIVLTTFNIERSLETGAKLRSLRSSIWKNVDGSWQIVFHQGTRTDQESI